MKAYLKKAQFVDSTTNTPKHASLQLSIETDTEAGLHDAQSVLRFIGEWVEVEMNLFIDEDHPYQQDFEDAERV